MHDHSRTYQCQPSVRLGTNLRRIFHVRQCNLFSAHNQMHLASST